MSFKEAIGNAKDCISHGSAAWSRRLALILLITIAAVFVSAEFGITEDSPATGLTNAGSAVMEQIRLRPLAFTENQGQWNEQALFRADAGGATLWFTGKGAYYQFTRTHPDATLSESNSPHDRLRDTPEEIESTTIKASYVGANSNPQVIGEEMMGHKCNYFIGNDPDAWRTNVPNYRAIVYENIYDGIDMKYYGNSERMEYDFIVSPGVDPSLIQVRYESANSLSVNESGQLVVETEWGYVVEDRPYVYQLAGDERVPIETQYKLVDDETFRFSIGTEYDPNSKLFIDPVISYSTYLRGAQRDEGTAIAVDAGGYTYVTGCTQSGSFPTPGAIFGSLYGTKDAFVTKFNPDGETLVYSTFLGGSGADCAYGIVADNGGNAYITGEAWDNFPTVSWAHEPDHQGYTDVFFSRLSKFGDTLWASTYLGGSDNYDYGYDICLDGSGDVYITGKTISNSFPCTPIA
jgi:hypothetical protein